MFDQEGETVPMAAGLSYVSALVHINKKFDMATRVSGDATLESDYYNGPDASRHGLTSVAKGVGPFPMKGNMTRATYEKLLTSLNRREGRHS